MLNFIKPDKSKIILSVLLYFVLIIMSSVLLIQYYQADDVKHYELYAISAKKSFETHMAVITELSKENATQDYYNYLNLTSTIFREYRPKSEEYIHISKPSIKRIEYSPLIYYYPKYREVIISLDRLVYYTYGYELNTQENELQWSWNAVLIVNAFEGDSVYDWETKYFGQYLIIAFNLLAPLVYFYIMSCILIFGYNRIKRSHASS